MGYSLSSAPFCWFGALDAEGNIEFDCPIELPKGVSPLAADGAFCAYTRRCCCRPCTIQLL